MTPSLKVAISKRQKAFCKYGKSSKSYKYWRNKVQHDVKVARSKCYSKSVEKLKNGNSSKWWREVKSLCGFASRSTWSQQLLSDDNPTATHLADSFNDFLVNLTSHFPPLTRDTSSIQYDIPHRFLVNPGIVSASLRQIKINKSTGPDNIPNKLLKIFANEFAPVLTDIYNASMQQGIFPQRLKRAVVIPIPKVSPPSSLENDLRPISLTSQVSKVLEGFTLKSLLLQVADKMDSKQFSLPNKSTTHALVYLLHSVLAALESGQCSIRLFFADFRKGFDLVDHNIIINELERLDVHPSIVRWIYDFLTDREQCVKIDNCYSSWKKTNGGLPQGTKLGPLLFAILVNHLLNNWHGRIKFVDDSTVFEIIPRGSPSLLQIGRAHV